MTRRNRRREIASISHAGHWPRSGRGIRRRSPGSAAAWLRYAEKYQSPVIIRRSRLCPVVDPGKKRTGSVSPGLPSHGVRNSVGAQPRIDQSGPDVRIAATDPRAPHATWPPPCPADPATGRTPRAGANGQRGSPGHRERRQIGSGLQCNASASLRFGQLTVNLLSLRFALVAVNCRLLGLMDGIRGRSRNTGRCRPQRRQDPPLGPAPSMPTSILTPR